MTTLSLTINGRKHGPIEIRDDLSMNDFLREMLGMTGTKFGCGAAQCLSCAIIVDSPDGTSYTTPDLRRSRRRISTASRSAPSRATPKTASSPRLQSAFIDHFAFQCGYCTAGFLNEGQVLLEASGDDAGGARGQLETVHRGCARRPSLPMHRLHQVSPGGARRGPRRFQTLSVANK